MAAFFCGCAATNPKISKTVFVSANSKDIKFADMGFFDEFEDKKSLEVYSLGMPVFKINFDDFVCVNSDCMSKERFVSEYISKALYADVMNDILSQKPLKIESKITKNVDGFVQEAKTDRYDITYSVDKEKIYFLERVGGFKFIVRFVNGN